MPLFDRAAAVDYAVKFAINPNACFPPFDNDCTSFVSQCMLAGGWTMIGGSFGDRKDDDAWWWGKSYWTTASYTWGGAHNFAKFLKRSGRASSAARSDVGSGDIVQIARSDDHVFHTMIVTGIYCSSQGDGPHVSFHTTNTLNAFLGEIEARHTAKGNKFLYWKVARSF